MQRFKIALFNLIVFVSIISVAVLSYLTITYSRQEYAESIYSYNETLRRLSRLVAGSAELNFLTIDQTLRKATEHEYLGGLFSDEDADNAKVGILAKWVNKTPHIDAILFTDKDGVVKRLFRKGENNFDVRAGIMFSAREHFEYHKAHPERELLISTLHRDDHSGIGRIFVSRRYEDEKNNFAGLVVAVMDGNYLLNLINSVETGQYTESYLLLNEDDYLAANLGGDDPKVALLKSLMNEVNFQEAIEGELVVAKRQVDDVLTMFSFQKIPGLPITVALVAKEKDIVAGWKDARNRYFSMVTIFAIIVFMIVGFSIVLVKKMLQARESEERALAASRAKMDFLAKMSHELRTPLNAIIGFSEMLSSGYFGKVNNTQLERLTDIHMCGNHLLDLISDILEFSKGEAGKLRLLEEETDMFNIARQAVRMIEERAGKQGVEIVNTVSRETPVLLADSRKLKQILLNLLSNAVKFTRSGGKVVIASCFDKNDNFVVSVTDTGIGIAAKDMAKAMEVFEQVHDDEGREGTGLGLPLCKMLAELHGGKFAIESKVGVGTKASFILPANRVKNNALNWAEYSMIHATAE